MERKTLIPLVTDYKKSQGKARKTNRLTFGKNNIIMTEEELALLIAQYKNYVEMYGVSFGFVHHLLSSGEKKWNS